LYPKTGEGSYCSLLFATYFSERQTARSNRECVHDGLARWHYFQLLARFRRTNSQAGKSNLLAAAEKLSCGHQRWKLLSSMCYVSRFLHDIPLNGTYR